MGISEQTWLFWFQALQAVGQVGSVIVAFIAVWTVQRYTQQKDEADFIRNRWNEQAQFNLACIQDDRILTSMEKIVYGESYDVDVSQSRTYFVIFLMLNQVHHLHIAREHGLLDEKEFNEHAIGTLSLLKSKEETVRYLLKERGYTESFKNIVTSLISKAPSPTPQMTRETSIQPHPPEKLSTLGEAQQR